MPGNDRERFEEIERIFHAAVEEPPGSARDALIESLCRHDPELQAEVLRLIESDASIPPDPPAEMLDFGAWRAVRLIGRGGMGTVYEVERFDGAFEMRAAVKVVPLALASLAIEERFRRERQFLARLDHPNIARLLDGGMSPTGLPFLVMELVDGLPIDRYCERHALDTAARVGLLRELLAALGYVHSRGLIHRDLKPSNVLVMDGGRLKLLDFGIAHLSDSSAPAGAAKTGFVAFTPEFACPEQARGETPAFHFDTYAAGKVMGRLLSGGEIPAPLQAVSDKAASEDPAARYASAEQMDQDLARYLAGEPVLATRRRGLKRRYWIAAALATVAMVAAFVGLRYIARQPVSGIAAIAVLPFDKLDASVDDSLSEGLTDEITAALSRIEGLRVAGRRSAYMFQGKHGDIRDIGARLHVDAVVEGSLRRTGNQVVAAVQLDRTRDGFTIWSRTFEGSAADVMPLESQAAAGIARALSREPRAGAASAVRPAPDPEAHAAYLQGRYLLNQRNLAAELKSVELMRKAVARDPNYALAWAGLADSLAVIGNNEDVPAADYMPPAREAARKALALDPDLAEAHAVLGVIACHYDYDWAAATREYRKALDLNPNYSPAHQWYALGLMAHGQFGDARRELETARLIDPLALIVGVDMAVLRKYQRDYDGVIAESQAVLQLDPNYKLGYSMLTTGYLCARRIPEWFQADAKVRQSDFDRAMARGRMDEARHFLKRTISLAEQGRNKSFLAFSYAARLGERELAMHWMERSYRNHDYWLLFMNVEPDLDPVRADPRFQAMAVRLGVR